MEKECKFGTWVYYMNDENRPRWKCSCCGKICKRLPQDKLYCSHCRAKMKLES